MRSFCFRYFRLLFLLIILHVYPVSISASEIIDPLAGWSLLNTSGYSIPSGGISVSNNGNMFVLGGSTTDDFDDVVRSNTNSLGVINEWVNVTKLPYTLYNHSYASTNNSLYIIGGMRWPPGLPIDLVSKGTFSNGDVNNWTPQSKLPSPLSSPASTYLNGYIYVSGGYSNSYNTSMRNIYWAKVDESSNTLTWNTSTILPKGTHSHGMVGYRGYLYIIGGRSDGVDTNLVYRVKVRSDGSIESWSEDKYLPTPIQRGSVLRVGNYILVIGGQQNEYKYNTTYYTQIGDDGKLATWEKSSALLPAPTCCGSSAVLNGYIYQLGAWDTTYSNKVYISKLNIPSDDPPPPPTVAKTPIVLIPGATACWNYDALVHSEIKANKDWKLGLYAAPYTRIIQALENAGYEKDKQLFVYCYDWRKSPVEDVPELDSLVNEVLIKNPTVTKVNIIGHSMGGLIGADYVSKYAQKVDKLVAAGSPFKGSANAYRVWEGADLTMYKGFEKIGVDLLMQVNIPKYPNKATEIRHMIPSVQSLLPIYDFIKKPSGKFTPWQEMIWHNEYLPTLNSSSILPKLSTVVGIGNDTIKSIQVKPRGGSSTKLEEWVDGEPTKMEYEMGDGSVLSESSMIGGIKNITLTGVDHFEVITSPTAQEEIMKLLGIEGRGVGDTIPKYRNALVVTVASPVTFQLITPDNTIVPSTDNLIVVDNPISGNYQVSVNGVSTGKYKIYFGRLSENTQAWDQINGIINIIGENKVSTFYVDMDAEHLGSDPINNATEEIDRLIGLLGTTQLDKSMTNFWEAKLLNLKRMILQKPTPIQNVMISLENFVSEKSDMGVWINMNPALRSEFEGGLRLISSWVTG